MAINLNKTEGLYLRLNDGGRLWFYSHSGFPFDPGKEKRFGESPNYSGDLPLGFQCGRAAGDSVVFSEAWSRRGATRMSAMAKYAISSEPKKPSSISLSSLQPPRTLILGFSKGGTAVNQLVTELGSLEDEAPVNPSRVREQPGVDESSVVHKEIQMIPTTKESLLNSISEIHYVDVGLNSSGAYITDKNVIESISKRLVHGGALGIRFVLHGTPRQWCDSRRTWIRDEKDRLCHLLESEAQRSGGRLKVCERFYFADRAPDMQMHFEVIEKMDVS
ncbi:putative Kinase superfamily protein [Hibiscus syriacus]|uniref:Kinase superfamily protein n=1 Tax=Hibiscus syriacus TaxID=106335 RepID=A0A6A2ZY15_HIBSY|nr:putative Kinase superfamily protein [Hibiscus syriacus]